MIGVRATYGVTYGKASFEVTITNNQNTDHLENEPNPHVLRVGWSIDFSSLALGTEMYSYGNLTFHPNMIFHSIDISS